MDMKAKNTDRVGILLFTVLFLVMCAFGVVIGQGDRAIALLVVYALMLIPGIKHNPTGWWAQYKWFGDPIEYYVDNGFFFVPWFLGYWYQRHDCRDQTYRLDGLKINTKNLAQVRIPRLALVWRIVHLGKFFMLNNDNLKELLDSVVDENVKDKVKDSELEEAVLIDLGTEEVETTRDLKQWGIEAVRIVAPEPPEPTDENVMKSLQRIPAERLQTKGDTEEIDNVIARVARLVAAGYSRADAIAQVDQTVNKAGKQIDVHKVVLEGSGGEMLEKAVRAFLGQKEKE